MVASNKKIGIPKLFELIISIALSSSFVRRIGFHMNKKNKLSLLLNLSLSSAILFGCGGGGGSDKTTTPPPPPANVAPTASAGDDQSVNEEVVVTLSGSGSDSDGTVSSYLWSQTAGAIVSLTGSSNASASFTAPTINSNETLTFQLTVTDDDGATATDSVDITVVNLNQAPTTSIDAVYSFAENNTVSITAMSSDPDMDTLSHQWEQTSGETIEFSMDHNVITFTTPEVNMNTSIGFKVTASDGEFQDSAESEIYITNLVPFPDKDENISTLPNKESYRLTESSVKNSQVPVWSSRENSITKQIPGEPIYIGDAATYIDVNNDGLMDLISFTGIGTSIGDLQQANIFINNGLDNFEQDDSFWQGNKPSLVHPRKALKADFNGDGEADVFFIGHGYDAEPFKGETLTYMLSTTNGYEARNLSDVGFWHGGSAADIDNDGDMDIVLVTGGNDFTFYRNDGLGNFTKSKSSVVMPSHGYYTLELIDINGDSIPDIVTGGHENEGAISTVLIGNGAGDFTAGSIPLPKLTGFGIVLDFDAEDINGDGHIDIIVNRTGDGDSGAGFYVGYEVELILNDGTNSFPTQISLFSGTDNWFPWIRVQDLDGDGDFDVFSEYKDNYYIWENEI